MANEVQPFDPIVETEGPQAFDPLATSGATLSFSRSEKSKDRKKNLLPPFVTASGEEVDMAVENEADFFMVEEARKAGRAANQEAIQNTFDESFENNEDPTVALMKLTEEIGNDPFVSKFVDPTVMSTILTGDNDLAKKAYLDKFRRVLILGDIMNEKQAEAEDPWWRDFDFVEMVVSELPGLTNVNTNRRIEMADQIGALLTSTATDAEFVEQVSSLFDEAADQGILSDNNKLFLNDLFALLGEGSGGREASNQKFWSWFDTVTIVGGVAARPVKGVVRSAIGHEMEEVALDTSTLIAKTGGDPKSTLRKAIADDSPETSSVNLGNKGPSALTPTRSRNEYLSAPEAQAMREIELENSILNDLITDGLPEAVDEDLFTQAAEGIIDARKAVNEERGTSRVVDYDVQKGTLENVFYSELLGTQKGSYFKSQTNAQKLADEVGGTVESTGKDQFVVRVTENVPLTTNTGNTIEDLRLFLGTDHQELGSGFWARWGSPLAQTTDRLNSILKQSEAKRAALHSLMDKNLKQSRKGLKKWEVNSVEKVYEELNFGRFAERKNPLSVAEFQNLYYTIHKRVMTPKETKFYESIQEFNDAAYYLESDLLFKDAVNKGLKVLDIDDFEIKVIQQNVDRVPDGDMVWDIEKKKLVVKKDIPEGANVYSAAESLYKTPIGEKVQYIVSRGGKVRRLYHTDVLAYNPGGPRMTVPGAVKVFVKQDQETVLASGRKVREAPRTVLGVRLTDEGDRAVSAINEIGAWVSAKLPSVLSLDELADAVRKLGRDADLESVLRKNNAWNPAIQTADDLANFIARTGYDPRKSVDWALDGSEFRAGGAEFLPGIDPTSTIGESVRFNAFGKGGRKNQLLLGYGGEPNLPVPALAAVERNFASTSARRVEAAYVSAAVSGLIKGLLENPKALRKSLDSNLAGLPLRAKLLKLDEYINDTDIGRKFKLERDKIEFRLNHQPINNVVFQKFKQDVADALYKKTGNSKLVQKIDMYSSDPISALKGYVFDAWLGLFAWDQYYVQASQIFNIVGISPLKGLQGAAAMMPTRFAILNGNEAVLKQTAKFVAPVLGVDADDYVTMVKMLKRDGRLVTGMSVTELGEESAFTGVFRGVRDKGRVFFNEGEIGARITGHITASLEYIQKFGSKGLDTQHGRRWVAHRQDTLTNAMTSASRAPFQRAPFTQFMSYSWRVSEAMFAGSLGGKKVLSNKEKLTLGAAHMAVYGAAGVPAAGYLMDKFKHKYGVEVPEEYHTAVRYGAIDTILSELIGADTALSTRLAWGEGIFDYFQNFTDKSTLEALGGPSFQFAGDFAGTAFNTMKSLTTGDKDLITADLTLLARQVKSGNMAYNTYMAVLFGDYIARNGGSIIKNDVTKNEAVALAFGIPLEVMVENRNVNNMMFNDSQFEKKIGKDIDRLMVQWQLSMQKDDLDAADTFRKQMGLIVQSLPPAQRKRVLNNIRPAINRLDSTTWWAIQRDYKNLGDN